MITGTKVRTPNEIQRILRIPNEVDKIVKHQVSFFKNFTAQYIFDHYNLGRKDMIIHFNGKEIGLIKNAELYAEQKGVEIRSSVVARVIGEFHENNPEYAKLIDELSLIIPFCFSDMPDEKLQHIPCLSFSKNSFSNTILIPSLNALMGYIEYGTIDHLDKPLFHKADKLCFAGSFTNVWWNSHGMEHNQRLQMAWMAKQAPDLWFCKIMKPPKADDDEWNELVQDVEKHFPGLTETEYFCQEEERTDVSDQLRYKFQVCVDGHTCPWSRLPWQMKSNSVVFKIKNPQDNFVEWFYPLLDPSKHFLEVETHHLMEAFQHMVHEPDHQLEISNNASEFVDKYLSSDLSKRILLYTLLLLNQKQNVELEDEGQ